jgi:hypothetical protein
MSTQSTAVYLYCVVRTPRRPSLTRVPAGLVGAGQPEAHRLAGPLWLIIALVPLAIYGPAHLEPRLRDLDWVGETAVAHESVVEHFARARGAVVLPAKLFTMFSSLEKAVEDIRRRKAIIERAMRHISGSQEWGVRIVRRAAAVASAGRRSRKGITSGAGFLTERKNARDAAVNARAAAFEAAASALTRLRRHAKDAQVREPRQEPGSNPPILEAAFLVTTRARTRFKAEARRQAAAVALAGADMTLTGPWPAYNFVDAPDGRS